MSEQNLKLVQTLGEALANMWKAGNDIRLLYIDLIKQKGC